MQMPTNMDQLQNIRKQKRIGANSTIGCVIWQILAQKSSSTQPEVTLPSATWTVRCKIMSLLQKPLQGFQGPSFTRPRTTAESSTSQQSPSTWKRSLWKRRNREEKFPCLRFNCRAKGFPLPGSFLLVTARRKVFDINSWLIQGIWLHLTAESTKNEGQPRGQELFGQETFLLWPESHTM